MRKLALKQKPPLQKSSAHLARQSRLAPAASHETHPLLRLQRTIGNQAVMRLLQARANNSTRDHGPTPGTIQPKLTVSAPGDIYEQEADRVSEQVMRMPEPQVQRACACDEGEDCANCQMDQQGQETQRLQPKHVGSSDAGRAAAPPIVNQVLASPGRPLDSATRAFMEPRFGHDFAHVRVHSDAAAEQSADDVNAKAYTVGNSIVFGAGSFAPGSAEGRRLIAHELAHVVQQTGTSGVAIQRQPKDTKVAAQDFAILLDPSKDFVTQATAVAPGAKIVHASSLDELAKKLKEIKVPIGTLFFVAHMTEDGDILFTSQDKMTFERAEVIAGKIKNTVQVEKIDFRGCAIAQAPAEMEKVRVALKATKITGSTCTVVTQIADPIKVGGKKITRPEQLKSSKVKSQFDAGFKKAQELFVEGKNKCIVNATVDGYFQTGGKLIAIWVNPGSMADSEGWDKTKSICHKDLKVEQVDPKKLPVIGPDDCKLLEIGKKP